MAEQAGDIIIDALGELVVQAAVADLQPDEVQLAIRYMNRFMFQLDANGIALGYTEVNSVSDTVTIAAGAMMGLVKNLAILLAPQFDAVVTPELARDASNGLKTMRRLGSSVIASSMPCTLPLGSGNEVDGLNNDFHFYPCPDDQILTETNRNILLEDNS